MVWDVWCGACGVAHVVWDVSNYNIESSTIARGNLPFSDVPVDAAVGAGMAAVAAVAAVGVGVGVGGVGVGIVSHRLDDPL